MRLSSLNRWHIIIAVMVISAYSLIGCSKNSGPGNGNKNDSDTVLHRTTVKYDSAVFYLTFNLEIQNTSNIYNDDYNDDASMYVYVVNGKVRVPHDSIKNYPPVVDHLSGSSGSWSAIWVPDNTGLINITDAAGLVIDDTSIALTFTQNAVNPIWKLSFMGGPYTAGGGDPSVGWPLALIFNPKLKDQTPINLVQPGSTWVARCHKDY